MKFKYNDNEFNLYRNTFMEHYTTESSKSDFEAFEQIFHVWIGLDHLNYYAKSPEYEKTLAYFKETIEGLNGFK